MIFLIFLSSFWVHGQELPGTVWRLNPAHKFAEKVGALKFNAPNGFSATYVSGDLEAQVKGTKIADPGVARQMTAVEFTTLEKLYSARGNPYEGQITDTVVCDKAFKPLTFTFRQNGQARKGLLGAANERYLFGACAKSQAHYWATYFSFYDEPSRMVIESRLFIPVGRPNAKKQIEKITQEFLVNK